MTSGITFLTITQNSEAVLSDCINSCKGLGRHLIIDGFSQDATVAIAESLDCQVLSREYAYSADQYNFGIDHVETDWCFVIDSDERLTPELRAELLSLDLDGRNVAYEVPRLNNVFGDELRYSGWWPDYNTRLFQVQRCRYDDRPVHARVIADGPIGKLKSPLYHLTYVSLEQYLEKFNRFTTREVRARSSSQVVTDRRSRLRKIWLRTPFRPATRFLYSYLFRLGFLDRHAGFRIAVLSAFYEFVASEKVRLERQRIDAQ